MGRVSHPYLRIVSLDGVAKLPTIWKLGVHFYPFMILRELGVIRGCVHGECVLVYSQVGSSQDFDSLISYQESLVVFP